MRLLPLLMGRVFHVTCGSNVQSIMHAGRIDTNRDGSRGGAFGRYDSYCRDRDRVSVFDFRDVEPDQLERALMDCSPWQGVRDCGHCLGIFFLGTAACARLVSRNEWAAAGWPKMLVPYVEAGHPGPLHVADLDELLEVKQRPS